MLKNKWFFLLLNLFLATLFFLITAPSYNLFNYINQLFYLAYFYLVVALLMWVIRGGFFDGITYSFRRFADRVSRNRDYLDDWETKKLPSQTVNNEVLKFFFFQGVFLSSGLLGLLVVYYQG
ncbi:DUF3899 domain-containing protein [Thalassobacillus sp. CUG 92003]|uniref:DUF3899 domain-containing protein n=1 Tax=Thalassobacillus sp. CUG 92003 TaxID=2736641 RepID=UPI002101EA0E|nr:DUF3899 domain-containing protein [Thalassobacillus sp. CUG 92003]